MSTSIRATCDCRSLAASVKRLAADCGYVDCGITTADPFLRDRSAVEDCIRRFPDAERLYTGFRKRCDPRVTAPWCNSVVVCLRWYGKYRLPQEALGHIGRHYLADCRVPACPDHGMAKRMTLGLRELGMRCKKGGVPDRWAAARAGVARFANNCCVVSGDYGSWVNVQTWRVDAALPADEPTLDSPCPPGCRACMDACPTAAIEAPLCMRMDRCIAYLTYGAPLPLEPRLAAKMNGWIYGCDACQQACPLNRGKWREIEAAPWVAEIADKLTPQALASMDEQTYRAVIHPLFWYISADDLVRWRANARRAVPTIGQMAKTGYVCRRSDSGVRNSST